MGYEGNLRHSGRILCKKRRLNTIHYQTTARLGWVATGKRRAKSNAKKTGNHN